MDIWNFRTDPNPDEGIKFPDTVPNGPQRLSVLWNMVKILGVTCPALSVDYLQTLKQIYLMHIQFGDIWMNETAADGTRLEQNHKRWLQAQAFIADCAQQVILHPVDNAAIPLPPVTLPAVPFKIFHVGCTPEDVSNMKTEHEVDAMEDFLLGESYDFVIEQIWLLLNYISPYCNYLSGFDNNYWSEFPLLFKRDFLYPVRDQWRDPGVWSSYYPLMFAGYDIEKERKLLISCVQQSLSPSTEMRPPPPPSAAAPEAPAAEDAEKKTEKRQLSLFDIEAEKKNAQAKLHLKEQLKKATGTTTTKKPHKGAKVAVKQVVSEVVAPPEGDPTTERLSSLVSEKLHDFLGDFE
ncbi:hypothetical protein Ocin01_17018 [Orchesella cincta]|uniref:Uncharacterized protein n=1 Tax=Orchesella cincta TaxID=48709 RepID=A0A1D2M9U9_ORCCI|nr:hypothetical protein Ocin01_17018 [Orchesella cincta]